MPLKFYSNFVVFGRACTPAFWLLTLVLGLSHHQTTAQIENLGLWTDYLPYNEGRQVVTYQNRIYVAAPDALFYVDKDDLSVHKFGKLQGLNDNNITALNTIPGKGLLFVGYNNGNLDIIDGDDVSNLGDLRRSTQFSGRKRINHIYTVGNTTYLSTNFGIQTIDLTRLFFRETFIIGPGAAEMEVYQTHIDAQAGFIYAATEQGLMRAQLGSQLIFFQNWQLVPEFPVGACKAITQFNNELVAIVAAGPNSNVYREVAGSWQPIPNQNFGEKLELKTTNIGLLITSAFNVTVYNNQYDFVRNLSVGFPFMPTTFSPNAAFVDANTQFSDIYIADNSNGLIRNWNETNLDFFKPRGPSTNNVFAMDAADEKLWVAPGGVDDVWSNLFNNDGLFSLQNFEWLDLRNQLPEDVRDIVDVAINPINKSQLFAAAYGYGILEFNNGQFVKLWNAANTNGALQNVAGVPGNYRVDGLSFDAEGNLWMGNSLTNFPLVVKRTDGKWENFGFGSLASTTTGVRKVLATQSGFKFVQTRENGLLVHSTNSRSAQVAALRTGTGSGNLPSNSVLDMAEDLNGEIWIGTTSGLVILFTPENIFNPSRNADAQPALILVDGQYERLLGSEAVTAIAIDGANKKWVGTRNSGVFYIAADGSQIIYNFTEQNSPLLSNSINAITIDQGSGEVFFGTQRGIVSFRGAATAGNRAFTNVFAYPNPVRPDYDGPIAIRGLVTNAQVKITDVGGNIVFETRAEGGQAIWDGTNFGGRKVASGVYLALLTNDDGSLTEVTKILIVR